ncbi:hypothetical protein JHW43_004179 [Diplocarpon mali]|nr:hypothetical protein JHW43_004179 [Diplocarpon mali]
MSTHKCSQCPGTKPQPSLLLPLQIPDELKVMIVAKMVVPERACMKDLHGRCFDPWSCDQGSHRSIEAGLDHATFNLPCPVITSMSPFIFEEGYKQFFRNHTFVFDCSANAEMEHLDSAVRSTEPEKNAKELDQIVSGFQTFRDAVAVRLLRFVDRPDDCDAKGSSQHRQDLDAAAYQCADKYRHEIKRIVFKSKDGWRWAHQIDWDWQLKVDWESLPNLKHLVLDLRTYSALSDAGALFEIDEILAAGARRMRGLNLKSLIIYGLCSSDLTRDVLGKHQQVIKSLFEGSLATDGTLELRDEEAPTSDW